MQKFYDTTGYLYAIRIWRLVVYVDNRAESLRYGGIVTSIGLARFVFWRFSWVNQRRTPRALDAASPYCECETPAFVPYIECENCRSSAPCGQRSFEK